MTIRRYSRTSRIKGGEMLGTPRISYIIYRGVQTGNISATKYVTRQDDRLDILAGDFYGDGRLWWVIGAASGIGWGLQVPPDIVLFIPDLNRIAEFVG